MNMNREIKFRAWDKKTNSWYDDSNQHLVINLDGTLTNCWNGELMEDYTERIILLPFTGIKDKNGAEVFEGDLVETQQSDLTSAPHEMVGGIVEWDSKNAMYKIKPLYGSKFHPITMFVRDVVVVGNKFENPELLEVEV